jgi:hypothetical protein
MPAHPEPARRIGCIRGSAVDFRFINFSFRPAPLVWFGTGSGYGQFGGLAAWNQASARPTRRCSGPACRATFVFLIAVQHAAIRPLSFNVGRHEMIPIYEQGHGNGIGHGLESFLSRFDQICSEHLEQERAKAFAFIFYDFHDHDLKRILRNQGVFAQLDRLSGESLSVFYLHTGDERAVRRFNGAFLSRLDLTSSAEPPCVAFFRLGKEGLKDVAVTQLDSADALHGFHELYGVIKRYLENDPAPSNGAKYLRWIKSAAKFISLETLRAALRAAFGHLPF